MVVPLLQEISKQAPQSGDYIASPIARQPDVPEPARIPATGRPQREERFTDHTESPIKEVLLKAIRDLGLPEPEQQYSILRGDGSLITRPDFAYSRLQIAIYCDSAEFHLNKEKWEKDRQIDRELLALHWRPIRFTGREIHNNSQKCAEDIKKYLRI